MDESFDGGNGHAEIKVSPKGVDLQAYERKIQEFIDWFEEQRVDLERDYDRATGEKKIEAAMELIDFIKEAVKKWNEIACPPPGPWEGTKKVTWSYFLGVGGIIQFKLEMTADIKIKIKKPVTPSSPSRIEGELENQKTKIDIDCPIPFMDLSILQSGTIVGLAEIAPPRAETCSLVKNIANLHVITETKNVGVVAGGIGFGPLFKMTWSRGSSTAFINVADIFGYQAPLYLNPHDENYKLTLEGLSLFDPQPHFIKYFRYYVRTLDEERFFTFDTTPIGVKHLIAFKTFNDMMGALALSESICIPDAICEVLNLWPTKENSLFDRWFDLWFTEGLRYYDLKVLENPNDLVRLFERFNWVLKMGEVKQLAIVSDALFERHELGYRQPLNDYTYEPYYVKAVEEWIRTITADSNQKGPALAWLLVQEYTVAVLCISDQAGIDLGLVPPPADARLKFMQAAGLAPRPPEE